MNKLKLLIAEDDHSIQRLYSKGLSIETFQLRIANNGEEAWEIYRSWKPEIVILDILMPIITGYQVLKNIRRFDEKAKKLDNKDEKTRAVIIMATSLKEKSDIMDCVKFGINGYIVKPFEFKKINDMVIDYYHKVYPE